MSFVRQFFGGNKHLRHIFFVMIVFFLIFFYVWPSTGDMIKSLVMPDSSDTMFICNENLNDNRPMMQLIDQEKLYKLPVIYFVTPTYPRREQIAELTRLGQTLMHIPNLHWIVADDHDSCNKYLDILLDRFGIPYTHISSPMPKVYRSRSTIPRGVANRRAALNYIRHNNKTFGVLYFGDDDNTFDLKLFQEIRYTKRVSMFPVGLIGTYAVSSPIVKNGEVIGFFDSWPAKRIWPVDMAGFAVNLEYLAKSPNATMPYTAGYEEDSFLRSIDLKLEDIEPKANDCTEILVWHTQTTKYKAPTLRVDTRSIHKDNSSLEKLLMHLETMGVSHTSTSSGVKTEISRDGKTRSLVSWFS